MDGVMFYTDITRWGTMSTTKEIIKEMFLVLLIVTFEIEKAASERMVRKIFDRTKKVMIIKFKTLFKTKFENTENQTQSSITCTEQVRLYYSEEMTRNRIP